MKCINCEYLKSLDGTNYYCDCFPEQLLPPHLVEIEIEDGCKSFEPKPNKQNKPGGDNLTKWTKDEVLSCIHNYFREMADKSLSIVGITKAIYNIHIRPNETLIQKDLDVIVRELENFEELDIKSIMNIVSTSKEALYCRVAY